MIEGSSAYLESFDPRIPPSLHVSRRDATRHNIPIPLVERRLESHAADDAEALTPEEIEWGNTPADGSEHS